MPRFQTLYRFVVMAATLAIAVMLWKLFGPPAEKVKGVTLRAIEWAENALREPAEPAAGPAAMPQVSPLPAGKMPVLAPTPPPLAPFVAGVTPVEGPQEPTIPPAKPLPRVETPPEVSADPMAALLAHLDELGVDERQLMPWGASGQMVRFCCRAPWGDSPQFGRHFEAVAAEPLTAVRQVVADVDAWRNTQKRSLVPQE
jgi:hypothetical protein